MSSREIAELTGKEHKHVIRDIRHMMTELGDGPTLDHVIETKDARGYTSCFHLPKDLTITLVAGYNVKMRHRITVRWLELEEPRNPVGFEWADALRLAAELEEHESKFGGTYLVPYN